ncbi:MAG TPA: hypothetical protein VF720_13635 [Candidatus Eisenbacteria bacterium]
MSAGHVVVSLAPLRPALILAMALLVSSLGCGGGGEPSVVEVEIDCPLSPKAPGTAFTLIARENMSTTHQWSVSSTTTAFRLTSDTTSVQSTFSLGEHQALLTVKTAPDPAQTSIYYSQIEVTAAQVGGLDVRVTDKERVDADICAVVIGSTGYVATDIHADVEAAIGSSAPRGLQPLLLGESQALGANDAGEVVGFIETSTGNRAFLWKNGFVVDLGPGSANAISSDGWITGSRPVTVPRPPDPDVIVDHAFLWQPTVPNGTTGTFIDLGTLVNPATNPFAGSYGSAINDNHDVAGTSDAEIGQQAFVTRNGVMVNIGAHAGATFSFAEGINNRGDVCGEVLGSVVQAALWPASGGVLDLHDETQVLESFATGINDSGFVVITGHTDQGSNLGFLWRSGSPLARLLIVSSSLSVAPEAINTAGAIVAEDSHNLFGFLASAPTAGNTILISNLTGEILRVRPNDLTDGGLIAGHFVRPTGTEAVLLMPQ